MSETNQQNEEWIKTNQQILEEMFSGQLTITKQETNNYFNTLFKIYREVPLVDKGLPNDITSTPGARHDLLTSTIGNYFGAMGWKYGYEIPSGDLNTSYRFDLLAQKEDKTIIVEVKPAIDTQMFGQIIGYIYHIKRRFNKVRILLGADIWVFGYLFEGGEITDIIVDLAKTRGLGGF